jgi:FG-GAP-like repeat/FG-GAP repeat
VSGTPVRRIGLGLLGLASWGAVLWACGAGGAGGGAPADPGAEAGPTVEAGALDASDAPRADAPAIDPASLAAPRPLAPLSTAKVSGQYPFLSWELPAGADGAHVEICKDRACTQVESTLDVVGTRGKVVAPLTAGVHFWRLRARALGATGVRTSATWELLVGHGAASTHDGSWGSFPDFDGDGIADLVAASSNDGVTQVATIFPGSAGTGPSTARSIELANPTPSVTTSFQELAAGDLDGDGFTELVVSSHDTAGPSHVYIWRGGPGGIAAGAAPDLRLDSAAPAFGYTIAALGDVNGDGYGELGVGGATVDVYFGGPTLADLTMRYSLAGAKVGPAGDVDGDGVADFVVQKGDATDSSLVLGVHGGTPTTVRPLLIPFLARSHVSAPLSKTPGDLDGDGTTDVVLGFFGAPTQPDGGAGNGVVYVFPGILGYGPFTEPTAALLGEPGDAPAFGTPALGNFNGDAYDDLVVGATLFGGNVGRIVLVPGGPGGVSQATPRTDFQGTVPNAAGSFGFSVANAGDVDGDGFVDIAVGNAGALCVVARGSTSPLSVTTPFFRMSGTKWVQVGVL